MKTFSFYYVHLYVLLSTKVRVASKNKNIGRYDWQLSSMKGGSCSAVTGHWSADSNDMIPLQCDCYS